MHVWVAAFDVLVALALVTLWYIGFLRYNRRKARQLLHWICSGSGREGKVTYVRWITASRFYLKLQFSAHCFREAYIKIQLLPREMPLNWLASRLRRQQELLTFEADLDCPPVFQLEVHNYRWRKHDFRQAPQSESVTLVRTGPVVLTTRGDWQQDLTNMMNGLLASRDCNFEMVQFRRESPHFRATVPLDSLDLRCDCAGQFFEALRELATGASAATF